MRVALLGDLAVGPGLERPLRVERRGPRMDLATRGADFVVEAPEEVEAEEPVDVAAVRQVVHVDVEVGKLEAERPEPRDAHEVARLAPDRRADHRSPIAAVRAVAERV